MENYEQKIEEAAQKQERVLNGSLKAAWINGAKSPEAKEYWQQGMYTEEEVKALIMSCLKATGDAIGAEMKNIGTKHAYIEFNGSELNKWFEQNKKK